MQTPIDVTRITWIHQQHFGFDTTLWFVHLDGTLDNSLLTLRRGEDGGEEATGIWQAFLTIPTVHRFERERHSFAYNFAKIEQAVVSSTLAAFVFAGRSSCASHSVTLEPIHRGALDLALPAYRRWLHARCPMEQPAQLHCSLKVTLAAEQLEQGQARLKNQFPGISLCQETTCASSYRWIFPLDAWLSEAQLMLLGLYEHAIRIPGAVSGAEFPAGQPEIDAWLSGREEPLVRDLPQGDDAPFAPPLVFPVPRRHRHRLFILGALLALGLAAWLGGHRKRETTGMTCHPQETANTVDER
jgi:hypothetical protein